MCRLALVCVALSLLLAAGGAIAADPPADRILVTFADPGMSNSARAGPVRPGYGRRTSTYLVSIGVRRAARSIEREFALQPLDEWPISPLKVHCIVYSIGEGRNVDELLQRLRDEPKVESAQRMNTFEVLGQSADTDAGYNELQHSAGSLQLAMAHRWSRGKGARISIIDTGADISHPEIAAQVVEHVDFVEEASAEFRADAHGTAIAGIIGASGDSKLGIVGVAPSSAVTVLKACWYTDRQKPAVCNSFTLAKALVFALESSADVINMSLSGPNDPLLARLVTEAVADGKIVIAASPPAASERMFFPAGVPGVIVVDVAGGAGKRARSGLVRAPGNDILVPIPGGGFDFASGSSLSAAHVSGVVALLLSRQPHLSREEIGALLTFADDPDRQSISACRALTKLMGQGECPMPSFASDGAY